MRPRHSSVTAAPAPGLRSAAVLSAAVCLAASLSACSVSNLQFVKDNRLHVVAPPQRALVRLPVAISWKMQGAGRRFAVFVDRAPVRPGQSLTAVADRSCRASPGCVTASYLARRGVYAVTGYELTLTQVADVNSYQSVQTHEATIVLLDSAGRRVGESAWYVDFRLRAPGIS